MPSNPFDEQAKNAVQDLTTSCLKSFALNYSKSYTLAVVGKIKGESETDEDPRRLLLSPTAPDVRKAGYLTKLGAVRKNWKKRWFVIDGDYRVAYFKNEKAADKAGAKPTGSFSCFGYKVKKEDDKKEEDKKNTVVLEPYWSDDVAKRVYQFTAASPEEYKDWTAIFTECCQNAGSPMHTDEVRREAFENTYIAMEEDAGWHPWSFTPTGSEADMLTYHIAKRIDYEVMRDVYSKVGTGFGSSTVKNKIRGVVAKMIATAVDAAWKLAQVALDKIEETVEESIRKVTGPLFELQAKVMNSAKGGITEKLAPILEKLLKPLAEKVMPKLAAPVSGFHATLYEAYCVRSEKKESASGFWWTLDTSSFTDLLDTVREVADILGLSNSAFWEFKWKCRDEACELLERALYTATVESRESAAGKLLHDSRKVMEEALEWLIGAVIRPLIMDQLAPIVEAIVGPLAELIPEAMQAFVDPVGSVMELVEHAINEAIKGAVQFPEQKTLFAIEDKFTVKVEMPSKDAPAQPLKRSPSQLPAPDAAHRKSIFYVAPEEEKDSDDEEDKEATSVAAAEEKSEEKSEEPPPAPEEPPPAPEEAPPAPAEEAPPAE